MSFLLPDLLQAYTDSWFLRQWYGADRASQDIGWAIIAHPIAPLQMQERWIRSMQATAQAQPNIALVKYWGKRNVVRNLPATGSISITLESLWTRMTVDFDAAEADTLVVNGMPDDRMLPRISRCLDQMAGGGRPAARILSECNFPIAAGLASSASAFAALVVAANRSADLSFDDAKLSRLAGQASGSAARSLYDGFVELTAGDAGIEVESVATSGQWPLEVIVAVTDEAEKPLSSGEAMIRCAKSSPFYATWVERQEQDLQAAREAIESRDFAKLASVSEHNCLKMHSVMWGARPPIVYWNKATLACMQAVRDLQSSGTAVFFTIDAGPQLKAVCLPDAAELLREALDSTDGVSSTMRSSLGTGARLVSGS
jgi:diphosphomevalonate decarboxylase